MTHVRYLLPNNNGRARETIHTPHLNTRTKTKSRTSKQTRVNGVIDATGKERGDGREGTVVRVGHQVWTSCCWKLQAVTLALLLLGTRGTVLSRVAWK